MNIEINGQTKKIVDNVTLQEIVTTFSPDNNKVVAELNEEIIPSKSWEETTVQDGDKIELVAFVGGG